MPKLPDYPGVLKIRTTWIVGADSSVGTTMHFLYSGTAPSDAVCASIASDVYSAAVSGLIPLLNTNNNLTGVQVQDLTSDTAGFGEHLAATDGSRTGEPLPAAVATLYSSSIARRYRGGKPRTYWPFGSASDVLNPSAWESAFVSAAQSGLDGFVAAIAALSVSGTILGARVSISYYESFTTVFNPVTGRTKNPPKVRTVAIAPDTILTSAVKGSPATQRRRSLLT